MTRMRTSALTLLVALYPLRSWGQSDLTLEAAIRTAWTNNPGLRAGDALVEASREDALAARDARLPTLELHAGALRTDEQMRYRGNHLGVRCGAEAGRGAIR